MKRKSNLFGEDIIKTEEEKNQESQQEEQKAEQSEATNQQEISANEIKISELASSNTNNNDDKKKVEVKSQIQTKLSKESLQSSSYPLTEEEKEIQNIKLEKELKLFDNEDDAEVTVSDPIKKDGFNSYIVYTVKVKSLKEPLYRRYNDFNMLRTKLIERWPGVYIPNIPPKKAVGNLDSKIITYRMKILNKFCSRICKYSFLQNSEEFTTFLTGNGDIEKALNGLGLQSYEEIYNRYKNTFVDYNEVNSYLFKDFNFDAAKAKINEMNLFFQKTIASIRTFREQVNQCMQKKAQEMESYFSLLSMFSDYEKYSLLEYADQNDSKLLFFNPKNSDLCLQMINLKDSQQNPYSKMHDWLIEEELDVEAIIESIASLNFLGETKEKMIQKKNTIVNNLNDLNTGKKTIKNIFSIKSKKSETTELETQKTTLEGQINFLDNILKISTFNMEKNINSFKEEKLADYYRSLKLCADIQKFNGRNISSLWTTISKDNNLQTVISNNVKLSEKSQTIEEFLGNESNKN